MLWTTQRKSHRFHIAVPIRLQGRDGSGGAFDFEAWTLDISAEGACINNIPERLELPRQLHVVADDYQFHADADVEIVWERELPQRAIGVRVEPGGRQRIWDAR
jgi:hypothetical protein